MHRLFQATVSRVLSKSPTAPSLALLLRPLSKDIKREDIGRHLFQSSVPLFSQHNMFGSVRHLSSYKEQLSYKDYINEVFGNTFHKLGPGVLATNQKLYQEAKKLMDNGSLDIPDELIMKCVVLKKKWIQVLNEAFAKSYDPQCDFGLGDDPAGRSEFGMRNPTDEVIQQAVIAEFWYTKQYNGDEKFRKMVAEIERKYESLLKDEPEITTSKRMV